MNKQILILAVLAILVVGAGVLYISQPGETPQTESVAQEDSQSLKTEETSHTEIEQKKETQASSNPSAPALATESGKVKAFTVEGSNFKFSLSEMRVKKGDTVKVTFINNDGIHDFVIDEFNAKSPQITTGNTAEVQFVADKTGTFEYYCSVGQHRAFGMKGNLVVE